MRYDDAVPEEPPPRDFGVPEISRFLGIVIAMYYRDHAPPHFHARYGRYRATVAMSPLRLLDGQLPPRVLGLVIEWAGQHAAELQDNWDRATRRLQLRPIAPLE